MHLSFGLLENADTNAGQRTPDKRWKRRTTMEKTDKRWKGRTNDGKDGKDGQTMEKMDAFSNRPTFHEYTQLVQQRPINVVRTFSLRCENVVNLRALNGILSTPTNVATALWHNVRKNVHTTYLERKFISV